MTTKKNITVQMEARLRVVPGEGEVEIEELREFLEQTLMCALRDHTGHTTLLSFGVEFPDSRTLDLAVECEGGEGDTALLPTTAAVPQIHVKRIGIHALPLPARAHPTDAGLDLRACLIGAKEDAEYDLEPGQTATFRVGFAFEIPPGYEGIIRGRSGMAFNQNVTVFHIGTIDASYRGVVGVMLRNDGEETVRINHGDRIAQLVIAPVLLATTVEVAELSDTTRGEGGFGSTGKE